MICGTDLKTYTNLCHFKEKQLTHPSVHVKSNGSCEGTKYFISLIRLYQTFNFVSTHLNWSTISWFLCYAELFKKTRECNDGPGCEGVSLDVCERFEWTRKRCPLTCKHCECRDLSDCQGVTAELCQSIPEYANNFCSMTCGVCGRSDGRYIQIYVYIYVIHQSINRKIKLE